MGVFFDAALVRHRLAYSAKLKKETLDTTSYQLDALNYLNKPFRWYSMESTMLDIRNHKPEELMFKDSSTGIITQIIDLTARELHGNTRCLIIFKDDMNQISYTTVGINGQWSLNVDGKNQMYSIILKPKKVMCVKPLMQLLKEQSFITSALGLAYHSGAISAFIAYDDMGKPLNQQNNHYSAACIKLFCEEKEI